MSIQMPLTPERLAVLQTAACALDALMVAHEGIHHAFFQGGDMEEAAWHTAMLMRTTDALRLAIGPGLVDLARVEQAAEEAYAGLPGAPGIVSAPATGETVVWEPSHVD